MTIVYRARAIRDLQRIYAYVASTSSPAHGYAVLGELVPQINDLVDHPDKGRRGQRRNERYFIALAFGQTYRVSYYRGRDRIAVKHIVDTRMHSA